MSSTPSVSAASLLRGAVLVTFFDGGHKVHTSFAHVLAVGQPDEQGHPALSVAYPDPAANAQVLASPNWYKGYRRVVGVKHVDHPDVVAGKESIAWGGTIATVDDLKGDGPEIPQPEGDGSRPYLKRQEPVDALEVSKAQAVAAQSGKTSSSSTQSPLVKETEVSQIATPVNQTPPPAPPAADAPAANTGTSGVASDAVGGAPSGTADGGADPQSTPQ